MRAIIIQSDRAKCVYWSTVSAVREVLFIRLWIKSLFIVVLYVYGCVCVHVCVCLCLCACTVHHVEVRGRLSAVCPFLPPWVLGNRPRSPLYQAVLPARRSVFQNLCLPEVFHTLQECQPVSFQGAMVLKVLVSQVVAGEGWHSGRCFPMPGAEMSVSVCCEQRLWGHHSPPHSHSSVCPRGRCS